jgi:hypothetical protein
MTSSARSTCMNCRFWFSTRQSRQFGEGDCTNPKVGEMVRCISMAHVERPDEYPHMNTVAPEQFSTSAQFGCIHHERLP